MRLSVIKIRNRGTRLKLTILAAFLITAFSFSTANASPGSPSISSSTHPTETAYYNTDPTFSFSATSDVSIAGYSYDYNQVRVMSPDLVSEGTGQTVTFQNVTDGTWYFHVVAVDSIGSWGAFNTRQFNIDKTAPVISSAFDGLKTAYHRGNISLKATASDALSGLNKIEFFKADDLLNSQTSSSATYTWDSRTTNGSIKITAKVTDNAGNQTSTKKTINVDNYKPKTYAPKKVTGYINGTVKLPYKVTDPYTDDTADVKIKIIRGRRVAKTLDLGAEKINKLAYHRFKPKLPVGVYRFQIYATDLAGNEQSNVASKILMIRQKKR